MLSQHRVEEIVTIHFCVDLMLSQHQVEEIVTIHLCVDLMLSQRQRTYSKIEIAFCM